MLRVSFSYASSMLQVCFEDASSMLRVCFKYASIMLQVCFNYALLIVAASKSRRRPCFIIKSDLETNHKQWGLYLGTLWLLICRTYNCDIIAGQTVYCTIFWYINYSVTVMPSKAISSISHPLTCLALKTLAENC